MDNKNRLGKERGKGAIMRKKTWKSDVIMHDKINEKGG